MKRFLLIALVVGLVAAFGITGFVAAQNPEPGTPQGQPGQGYGRFGRGMMGGATAQGTGLMHDYMEEALAGELGISVEELEAAHAEGKTFWQLAEEKGLSVEEAQQAMLDARSAALDKMVEDGTLTQEQADWMKQRGAGMMGGRGGRMGQGGCPGMNNGGTFGPRGRFSTDS